MVSQQYGTAHREFTVEGDALDALDRLFWHYDEPFADSSALPTYPRVAPGAPDGDGGAVGRRRRRELRRLPALLLRSAGEHACAASCRRRHAGRCSGRWRPCTRRRTALPQPLRAKTLLHNLSLTAVAGLLQHHDLVHRRRQGRALQRRDRGAASADFSVFDVFARHFESADTDDPLSRIQYVDVKTYLVDDILTKVDRASMAVSLEVRVPLLDHVFMERMARMPSRFKLQRPRGQVHLQEGAGEAPAAGCPVPAARWASRCRWPNGGAGSCAPPSRTACSARTVFCAGLFEPRAMARLWHDQQRGTRDNAYKLWILFALEKWAGHYAR